jgi:hypothetical protein
MNAPNGVNLMANTGLLGLTVPLVPVTLLLGPAVAFTVMLTGGLTATAWAWYHVLSRHIVGYWPAALVGGLFAGFAPGMISHVNGHPDLVGQFLIPFIIWRAISLRTARDGVVLGLLVTWQAFLNEELLLQTGLAVAVFVAVYAVFRPAEDTATGQGYRMVGGYFLVRDDHGRGAYGVPGRPTSVLLTDIVRYGGTRQITAAQRAAFRADLRYWHTAIVVLSPYAPHYDELRHALDQLTGEPARQVQGVVLWDVGKLAGCLPVRYFIPRRAVWRSGNCPHRGLRPARSLSAPCALASAVAPNGWCTAARSLPSWRWMTRSTRLAVPSPIPSPMGMRASAK